MVYVLTHCVLQHTTDPEHGVCVCMHSKIKESHKHVFPLYVYACECKRVCVYAVRLRLRSVVSPPEEHLEGCQRDE